MLLGNRSTSTPSHCYCSVMSADSPSRTKISAANFSLRSPRFAPTSTTTPLPSSSYRQKRWNATTRKEIAKSEGNVDKRKVAASLSPTELQFAPVAPSFPYPLYSTPLLPSTDSRSPPTSLDRFPSSVQYSPTSRRLSSKSLRNSLFPPPLVHRPLKPPVRRSRKESRRRVLLEKAIRRDSATPSVLTG